MTKSVSTSLSPIIPAISPDALFRSVTNLPHHAESRAEFGRASGADGGGLQHADAGQV